MHVASAILEDRVGPFCIIFKYANYHILIQTATPSIYRRRFIHVHRAIKNLHKSDNR